MFKVSTVENVYGVVIPLEVMMSYGWGFKWLDKWKCSSFHMRCSNF